MNRNRTRRHLLHVVAIALSAVVLGVFPGGMLRSTVAHASYARDALGSAVGTRGAGPLLARSLELGAKLDISISGDVPSTTPFIHLPGGGGATPYQWMRWVTTNGPGFYNNDGVFAEPLEPATYGEGGYFFLDGQDEFGNQIFHIQVLGDIDPNTGDWMLDLFDHISETLPDAAYRVDSTEYPTAAQAAQPFRQCIASWVNQFGQVFGNLVGDADGTAGEVGEDVEQLEEMIAQILPL